MKKKTVRGVYHTPLCGGLISTAIYQLTASVV
jgi:hypothetical protein